MLSNVSFYQTSFFTFYEDDMLSSKIILIFFDWDYLLHKLSINFLLSLNMES
jgi:hypothetical protein